LLFFVLWNHSKKKVVVFIPILKRAGGGGDDGDDDVDGVDDGDDDGSFVFIPMLKRLLELEASRRGSRRKRRGK
jgi:hypothetical protein